MYNKNNRNNRDNRTRNLETRAIKTTKAIWLTKLLPILFELNIEMPKEPLNWNKLFNSTHALRNIDFNKLLNTLNYYSRFLLAKRALASLGISIMKVNGKITIMPLDSINLEKLGDCFDREGSSINNTSEAVTNQEVAEEEEEHTEAIEVQEPSEDFEDDDFLDDEVSEYDIDQADAVTDKEQKVEDIE